jgi:hypothetical protein
MTIPLFTWLPMLHLPQVPDNLVHQAIEIASANSSTDSSYIDVDHHYRYRTLVKDNQTMQSRCQIACNMDQNWITWVNDNIVSGCLETGVRVNNVNGSTVHGPHTDPPVQKYKLYYLIKEGGDNVLTCWYQEHNQPLIRPAGTTVCDFSQVSKIDQLTIPKHQWLLFNTNILHGIENVVTQRVNLSVTLAVDHPFITNYFNL